MNRTREAEAIAGRILADDPPELTDGDVRLVKELVFALIWSEETNQLAKQQMSSLLEMP